jgi:hypothetical protein
MKRSFALLAVACLLHFAGCAESPTKPSNSALAGSTTNATSVRYIEGPWDISLIQTALDGQANLTGTLTNAAGFSGTFNGLLTGTLEDGTLAGTLDTIDANGCIATGSVRGRLSGGGLSWTPQDAVSQCPDSWPMLGIISITPSSRSKYEACTYEAVAEERSLAASGGKASIHVTTRSDCGWFARYATAGANDLHVEPDAGQGSADIAVTLPPNGLTAQRLVSVVVGGQIVRLAQDGASVKECKYRLNGDSRSFTAEGGGGGVDMRTAAGCAWEAESHAPWLRIVSGMKGTGDGTVTYTLEHNPGTAQRTATLSAEGSVFTVIQKGIRCRYEVPRPAQTAFLAAGGGASTTVTTAPPCSWDAVTDVPWISVTKGQLGSGTVAFTVLPNPEPADREGGVTVAGQRIPILQAGPCRYAVNARANFGATGVTWAAFVQTHPACSWTASSDVPWVKVASPLPVKGAGSFDYVVDANGTGVPRAGTLIVMDQRVSIVQTARTDIPFVYGRVKNRVTQLPLAGAMVSIRGAFSGDATTNASGDFSIPNGQAGFVTITISANGFVTDTRQLELEGGMVWNVGTDLIPAAASSSSIR